MKLILPEHFSFQQGKSTALKLVSSMQIHPLHWANPNDYDLPSDYILILTSAFDSIPIVSNFWRDLIPFGWSDPPNGIFSHQVGSLVFPPLKEYKDVTGGVIDFLREDDTVLGDLTHPHTFIVVVVVAILIHQIKFALYPFFQSLAKNVGAKTFGKEWVVQNPERIFKFSEYCFRLIYHTSLSIYGLWYFNNNDWWHSSNGGTQSYYIGYPNHLLRPDIIWYCLIQVGYNFDAMVSLLLMSFSLNLNMKKIPFVHVGWSKTVRGDFREMFIHHFITNTLMFMGSKCRLTRSMSYFLILHDISDIPVDLSKLANFMKWKMTTFVFFGIMCIVWLITRLTILPFVVFKSVAFESYIILIEKSVTPEIYFCYRSMFVLLSAGIITLHVLWFIMFLKMLKTAILKGEQHDLSEHKKGEKNANPIEKKQN